MDGECMNCGESGNWCQCDVGDEIDYQALTDCQKLAAKDVEIAALRNRIEQLTDDLVATRHSHAKITRAVKSFLGFKNWPKFNGSLADYIVELLKK